MFEHANAHDAIKWLCEVTVVLETDFDGETAAKFGCMTTLLLRDSDPNNAASVVFGCVFGEPTPSAANIQEMHPFLESELAADQIHLFALCLGEVVSAPKPCA